MAEWNAMPRTTAKILAEIQHERNVKRRMERINKKMVEFAKGVNVKVVQTKYGDIIKIGIKLEEFGDNPITDSGYINFDIKTSKSGNKYAEINTYKKQEEIDGGEIPY
jgi:hypothetical protein